MESAENHAFEFKTVDPPTTPSTVSTPSPSPLTTLVFDVEDGLRRVACGVQTARDAAVAAKRRRDVLDECIRSNLCETPDGQMRVMRNDSDKMSMLGMVFEADQAYVDASNTYHVVLGGVLRALHVIGTSNTAEP